MYLLARYFTVNDDDGLPYYLGEKAFPTTQGKIGELLVNDEEIVNLANGIGDILAFDPHVIPEANSSFSIFIERGEDKGSGSDCILNFWLASSPPVVRVSYFEFGQSKNKCLKFPAHCWDLYLGANFNSTIKNVVALSKCLREKEEIKDNKMIRFMMYQDVKFLPPYVYGYYKPETPIEVPGDCYLLEICCLYTGFYYSVKRDRWKNSQETLTEEDFTELD